jgi:hypothetical protein
MEGYCSTGQSPQRAVVPVEEEEEEEYIYLFLLLYIPQLFDWLAAFHLELLQAILFICCITVSFCAFIIILWLLL